jgi:uncharacterized protein YjbJ (UPF0337 family)
MNKDQAKGKVENIKGRVKEAGGALSGDKRAQAEGMAERVKGAAQEKLGDAKHKIARDVEKDDTDE